MRNIILLFLFFCIHSSDALFNYCIKAFSSKKDFFSDIYDQTHDPLSKTLVEGYQVAYELKWFDGKKQVKEFAEGLKDMVEFLEQSPTQKEKAVLNSLGVSLDTLIYKTSEIVEFVRQSSSEEYFDFKPVTQAIFSMFSKHLPILLKQDLHQVDWPRMNLILREMANFDPQNPRFSLYKIKRAIEGRYSLKEFILCRI